MCEDCDRYRPDCSECGPERKHDCRNPTSCKRGHVWDSRINKSRPKFCKLNCDDHTTNKLDVNKSYYTEILVKPTVAKDMYQRVAGSFMSQTCKECDPSCPSCFGPGPYSCNSCQNNKRRSSDIDILNYFNTRSYLGPEWVYDMSEKKITWEQKKENCSYVQNKSIES
jgi:hypothetical protein